MSVKAAMSVTEYHEASWAAYDRRDAPPDPSGLSDGALHAFMEYEAPSLLLPSQAHEAVGAESTRRGLPPEPSDRLAGLALMAALVIVGLLIGWALLAL
jgi:hypothetical protein